MGSNVAKIIPARSAYCALKNDGTIVSWGDFQFGENIHHETYGINANGGDITKIKNIGVKDVPLMKKGFLQY